MPVTFRRARREDVSDIVRLLADDEIGRTREQHDGPPQASYWAAFDAIDGDERQLLVVAETTDGAVVGTLQVSFLTHMTFGGGTRAQIEGVRVDRSTRGAGIGRLMIEWAIDQARQRGCHLVQLTTNKRRPDAIRFYEGVGFDATHEGFKLEL